MARKALAAGRRFAAPDGLPLRDGGLRVTGPGGRVVTVTPETLRYGEEQLAIRAADGAPEGRLGAEAAAWLAGEVAAQAGRPRAEGALEALQRMAEIIPPSAPEVAAVRKEIIAGNPHGTEQVPAAPTTIDVVLPAGGHDALAEEIAQLAVMLPADPSTVVTTDPGTSHTRQEGVAPAAPAPSTGPAHPGDPAHALRLGLEEVRPSDLGHEVVGWHWSGDVLAVETRSWGTQRFRPEFGDVARGDVAIGDDGFTVAPSAAPEDMPRVWQHVIADRLQRLAAADVRSEQGLVRRIVNDVRTALRGPDRTVEGDTRHRYLARRWLATTDPVERAQLAADINDLANDLRAQGKTPPQPPWLSGADGVLPPEAQAVLLTPLSELAAKVSGLNDALARDVDALRERVDFHRKNATEAGENADKAFEKALAMAREGDSGASDRERAATGEMEKAFASQEHHERMASRYERALQRATRARESYTGLAERLEETGRASGAEVAENVQAVRPLAAEAREHVASYREALADNLPSEAALPSAVPTDRLPMARANSEAVNDALAENGSDIRFSPDQLEQWMGARFRRIVSSDGGVLHLADGRVLRVWMEAGDLEEVVDSPRQPSETLTGAGLPQSGDTIGSTIGRNISVPVNVDVSTLIAEALPPHSTVKHVADHITVSGGVTKGGGVNRSGGAMLDGWFGDVADDRGPKTLFRARKVVTRVEVSNPESGRVTRRVVDTGLGDEKTTLDVWMSNGTAAGPPAETIQLPPGERQKVPFPDHVPHGVEGHVPLFEKTERELASQGMTLSRMAREELETWLTEDLRSKSYTAINEPGGLKFQLHEHGRPILDVRVVKKVVLDDAELVATNESWQEKLRIGVTTVNGSETFNRSSGVSASLGVKLPGLSSFDAMPGKHLYKAGATLKASGSLNRAYSDGLSVGSTAYTVSVNRTTGHEVLIRFKTVYELTATEIGTGRRITVTQEGRDLLQAPEDELFRHGAPVDAAAVMRDGTGAVRRHPDGSVVLRDDPSPGVPEGRRAALPDFVGDGPGQVRGAPGPAIVDVAYLGNNAEEHAYASQTIIDELRERGILPEVDKDGMQIWRPHGDMVEQEGQAIAWQQVQKALDPRFIATHYNKVAQGGVTIYLEHLSSHRAARVHTLVIEKHQDLAGADPRGTTGKRGHAHLSIGSGTVSRSRSWSKNRSYGGGVAVAHDPGKVGFGPEADASHARNPGRTEGVSEGNTRNGVVLRADGDGPFVEFAVPDKSRVTIDGAEIVAQPGKTDVLWPVHMLPRADEPVGAAGRELRPLSPEAVKALDLRNLDLRGAKDRIAQALGIKKGTPAYAQLEAELDPDYLVSFHEWLRGTPHRFELIVDPHGLSPTAHSIELWAKEVRAADPSPVPGVGGPIRLTLGSTGSTSSTSRGHSTTGSASGTEHMSGGATGGGSGKISRSRGTSESTSELAIRGDEHLDIKLDRDLLGGGEIELGVKVSRNGGADVIVEDLPSASAVLSYKATDAMHLYARGQLDLPVPLVADEVERFLNGNLFPDRDAVAPLVGRYLTDRAAAEASGAPPVPLADGHTPERLEQKVMAATGLDAELTDTTAEHRLNDLLMRGRPGELAPLRVTVPDPLQKSPDMVYEMTLRNEAGQETTVYDAVRSAIETVAPKAVRVDEALHRALELAFGGDRALGALPNAADPWGFPERLPVKVNALGGAQELTVWLNVGLGDELELHAHRPDRGIIKQGYGYEQWGRSEGANRATSGGVDGTGSMADANADVGVSTGRSTSVTASVGEQLTELSRFAKFGVARIGQDIDVTVRVERAALKTGQVPGDQAEPDGKQPKPPASVTVRLTGKIVRGVPSELVMPEGTQPRMEPDRVLDPRPISFEGAMLYPQGIEGHKIYNALYDTFTDALGTKHLREVVFQTASQWSNTSRGAFLSRLLHERGYDVHVPHGGRRKTANIRIVTLSDPRVVAELSEAEFGEVRRDMPTSQVVVAPGRLFALGRSAQGGYNIGGTPVSGGPGSGVQASDSVAHAGGARDETSAFEKGPGLIVEFNTEAIVTSGGKSVTVEDKSVLIMAKHEYDAARARQEAAESGGWSLEPGDGWTEGGFREAEHALPSWLSALARENGLDLRQMFNQRQGGGTFADQVRAELRSRHVTLPEENRPIWPGTPQTATEPAGEWHGEVTGEGGVPGSA